MPHNVRPLEKKNRGVYFCANFTGAITYYFNNTPASSTFINLALICAIFYAAAFRTSNEPGTKGGPCERVPWWVFKRSFFLSLNKQYASGLPFVHPPASFIPWPPFHSPATVNNGSLSLQPEEASRCAGWTTTTSTLFYSKDANCSQLRYCF